MEHVAVLVMIFMVVLCSRPVGAQNANIYNISFDERGEASFYAIEVKLPETSTAEEYAAALITALFDKQNSPNFAPVGTQILTLIINGNHLTMNLSREILSFGEEYYNECLRRQIAKTALEVPQVDIVTILVDNSNFYRIQRPSGNTLEH